MKCLLRVGVVAVLSVATVAAAQEAAPELFPFDGIVTGDYVHVRSGPDINYYPVSRLMTGNEVKVVGEEFGWYKIIPPPGSFSWVEKQYLERTTDDKGTVNADRVSVRAGSALDETRNMAIQLIVGRGQELTIIGEKGDWYKVLPPTGAYLYISGRYVKPVRGPSAPLTPAAKPTPKPEKEKPTTQPTTQPAGPTIDEEQKKKLDLLAPHGEKILQLEQALTEEMKKPLEQQQWDKIIAEYQAIADQKENELAAQLATKYLDVIDYQKSSRDGYQRLIKLKQEFDKTRGETQEDLVELRTRTLETPPRVWQAEGILKVSHVFRGPRVPKRYRLFDPQQNRTVAYLELAKDSDVTIEKFLDKYVAVSGQVYYDPKLRIRIIKASKFLVKSPPGTPTEEAK